VSAVLYLSKMLGHLTAFMLDFEVVFVVRHPHLHVVHGTANIASAADEIQNKIDYPL